ncbi:putative Zn(II)2Cys6 transcription factor [Aspergillus steynii IBT 23096]|uniref:Putative Zn(II)2Cys6 transcription factor n=1 Tax=Aspergillus steynii IBT 23096 TaxID=1392250 RepID=A0A2I2FXE2_9EURO|nr:putative Zn(II)2Cys6 transcription factor [Aspergillus steynii IBT 23096]PLB45287.1 putative Zn(II)2Cys6 transcription factor [Aspergillus steynii IBT 23096]
MRPSWKTPSRSGCLECRDRRMKCTRELPKCSGCIRHNILCQYLSSTPWQSPSPSPRSSPSIPDSLFFAETTDDPMASFAHHSLPEDLHTRELELMMQWCTATYRTIARNDAVEWIWHAVVPREAMRYPALMHGILALSALHLSFANGSSTKDAYLRLAQAHQSLAAVGVTTKAAGSPNLADCNATFALSNLMIVYCFGCARIMGPVKDTPVLDELCRVFQCAQESADVLAVLVDRVSQGELRLLLECDNSQPKMPDTSRLAIMALSRLNASLAARDSHHEKAMYDAIIDHLGHSLDKLARGGEVMVILFHWIFNLPSRFCDLLKENHPFALVILAHYAVVIHSLRGNWWMGDLGTRVIEQIGRSLGAEWRSSIDWVIDATGCYIPPL